MQTLADTARATAERFYMFPGGAPVVVMVSGGADSTALARLLASGALGELDLTILHVNHLLRGDESDADEAFVADVAGELGVPVRIVRYDVGGFAEAQGVNLEDAGRRIRYRFADEELDALCDAAGVPRASGRIATAHTLDDRAETFLMRILTGAGAGGLASIPYVRGRIVRPLLDLPREDVRSWLQAGGYEWREDASNLDLSRTRALVRHRFVPLAREANPRFLQSLARTMNLLADDDAVLSEMADAFAAQFAEVQPGRSVALDRELMATLSVPMRRRTVRSALLAAFPEASRLELVHVDALAEGLATDGFSHDLPGGLHARTEYTEMVVTKGVEDPGGVAPSLLSIPGTADCGDAGFIHAERTAADDLGGTSDSVVVSVPEGAMLVVDAVRPGDRMQPLGMTGTRKLQDLLVDAKIPRRLRGSVPVVRDGNTIVWLAGVRMSDRYKVLPGTLSAVRLTWDRPRDHESWTR